MKTSSPSALPASSRALLALAASLCVAPALAATAGARGAAAAERGRAPEAPAAQVEAAGSSKADAAKPDGDARAFDPSMHAPPKADESPTAWSCTIETLLKGEQCVFESEAEAGEESQAQALSNARAANALVDKACNRAARASTSAPPDKTVLALCRKDFQEAADGCAIEGARPLMDAKGRFSPAARPCYFAMGEVLRKARLMATVAAPCCRCAAERCKAPLESCARALSGVKPRLSDCAVAECSDACAPLLPTEEDEPTEPAPREPARSRKIIDL